MTRNSDQISLVAMLMVLCFMLLEYLILVVVDLQGIFYFFSLDNSSWNNSGNICNSYLVLDKVPVEGTQQKVDKPDKNV